LVRKFNRLELGRSRGETFPTHALSSSQTTAGGTSGPAWRTSASRRSSAIWSPRHRWSASARRSHRSWT